MTYRGIFEYEYPTEHKPPVGIDVYLHGDCVKGKIIEWEYRPLEQKPTTKIEESNFSQEQYLADLQGAYDCGKSVLDKIFCIVHPLSIMSTPELEHKAIMQIAEMLEPLCLPESEDT